MQIHELNNFTGTLGSGAYLAIDDGTDTGKISSQGLLAATEARIDNIIAGPAPSAEEIVDARLGADGVTYPSLGDAIRDQFTDVKSEINNIAVNSNKNLFDGNYINGYISGTGTGARISTNDAGKLIALDIEASTTYSIIKEATEQESGYYWLKVATSTMTKDEFLATISSGWSTYFDGGVFYNGASTSTNLLNYTFTTGASDKSVFILVSRGLEPYAEVLKGTYTHFQYNSYNPIYVPAYLDCFTKAETMTAISDNKPLLVKKGADYLMIYKSQGTKFLGYKYGLYTNNTIHVNVWRLCDISVYDSDFSLLWTINPDTSDVEGVIKISGESDYVGSIHGDEQFSDVTILMDGKPIAFNSIVDGYYESVEFLVSSNVYHENDTSNVAFAKQKATTISADGVNVNMIYIPQANMTIDRLRLPMNVPRKVGEDYTVEYYFDTIVNLLPSNIPTDGSTGDIGYSTKLRDVTMAGDMCNVEVQTVKLGGTDSRGRITMFADRLKPYFDCYMSNTVTASEKIYAEYRYKITVY